MNILSSTREHSNGVHWRMRPRPRGLTKAISIGSRLAVLSDASEASATVVTRSCLRVAVACFCSLTVFCGRGADGDRPWLMVPESQERIQTAVLVHDSVQTSVDGLVQLVDTDGRTAAATIMPGPAKDGSLGASGTRLALDIPPGKPGEGERRFQVRARTPLAKESPGFAFRAVTDKSLGIWEDDKLVLVYNHGMMSREGVPADRNRSSYVHPLYGLDGEVLTDDFPADHRHHRGLFWAWPHVIVGNSEYSLWDIKGVHQRFERWLVQKTESGVAVLAVENGWHAGERQLIQERVWLRVYRSFANARMIDVELFWVPVYKAVTLRGAEGKSYGGLTLRFAPRPASTISTPLGNGADDLTMTSLPWADLSAQFAGASQPSGAAVFIHPDHPDYPPTWLTRHYGVLCVGWPGVNGRTFPVGVPFACHYRIFVHRGKADAATLERHYAAYLAGCRLNFE